MDELFAELRPDLDPLSETLFSASEVLVRKRGEFLPHGAVLAADRTVRLVAVAPDNLNDMVSAVEILPRLHHVLRLEAEREELLAVAVSEDVSIMPAGSKRTKAVKVLIEHRRGLSVALYLPWKRQMFGGSSFGDMIALSAPPEVRPWDRGGRA